MFPLSTFNNNVLLASTRGWSAWYWKEYVSCKYSGTEPGIRCPVWWIYIQEKYNPTKWNDNNTHRRLSTRRRTSCHRSRIDIRRWFIIHNKYFIYLFIFYFMVIYYVLFGGIIFRLMVFIIDECSYTKMESRVVFGQRNDLRKCQKCHIFSRIIGGGLRFLTWKSYVPHNNTYNI